MHLRITVIVICLCPLPVPLIIAADSRDEQRAQTELELQNLRQKIKALQSNQEQNRSKLSEEHLSIMLYGEGSLMVKYPLVMPVVSLTCDKIALPLASPSVPYTSVENILIPIGVTGNQIRG